MKKEKNNSWKEEKIEIDNNVKKKEEVLPQKKEKSWLSKEGVLAVDVYQTESDIVIEAPIAGAKKEDLEITTEKDIVIIKGKRDRLVSSEEIKSFYVKECFFGNFRKEVILPEETDPSRIKADIKEGILLIKVPKIEREKKRKIEI